MPEHIPLALYLLVAFAGTGLVAGLGLFCHGLWLRRQAEKWNRIAPPPSKRQTER